MSTASPAVEIDDLVMRYGDKTAVDGLSLEVVRGSITAVLGPNGAGKTTTLETCEGYRAPQQGTVRVLGLDPQRDRAALLPRIGVMLQAGGAWSGVRAHEMLAHMAALHAHPLDVAMLSERLGLADCGRTPYRRLSGGQQQRLGLAIALVGRPELVFVDEPTAGMDPQARRTTWELLEEIRADGVTVVLTTHHMDEAEILCDRVAVMDAGRILQLDSPVALIRALDAPVRISVERGVLTPAQAAAIPGAEHVEAEATSTVISTREPARVLSALADADALAGLQVRGATLEDVFLDLTGREYRV